MNSNSPTEAFRSANKKAGKKFGNLTDEVGKKPGQPNSTTTLQSSPILSLLGDVKDVKDRRAYEVARQQARRPGDRRKAKEQKTKRHPQVGAVNTGIAGTTARPRGSGALVVVDDSGDDELGSPLESGFKSSDEVSKGAPRSLSVGLEDLVRNAKVRKEKAGDFELVPHIRPVLTLDDSDTVFSTRVETTIPDFIDDDWEHIESCEDSTSSSDEDEVTKRETTIMNARSYAQVLTTANDNSL